MNKQELETKREDLFEQIGSDLTSATSELDRINSDLEQFEESIEDLESRYEELPPEEKGPFAEAIRHVIDQIRGTKSPKRLLEFEDELQEASDNPLIESIQGELLHFYNQVGIEFSDRDEKEILLKIQASVKPDPDEAHGVAKRLTELINDLTHPTLKAIRHEIYSDSTPITDPQRLYDISIEIEERHNSLESIRGDFERVEWIPPELEAIDQWVVLYDLSKNVDPLEELIPQINEQIESLPDAIPIQETTKLHLSERIDEIKQTPQSVFDQVNNHIASITTYNDDLRDIEQLTELVDLETTNISFLNSFNHLSSNPPNNLEDLSSSIREICSDYAQWKEDITNRWANLRPVIETYDDRLDSTPPDRVSDYLDRQLPVEEEMPRAFSTLIQAEGWIESMEEEMLEQLSDEARDFFYDLTSQGEREISGDDLDALEEVIKLLELKVVINE